MTILKFKLDKEDHVNFQLYVASKSERIKKKRKKAKIRIPVLYAILGIFLLAFSQMQLSLIFLIIAVLWFFIFPKYERKRYEKHYLSFVEENFKSNDEYDATIELGEDEISSTDMMGHATVKIEKIIEVDEIEKYFFMRISPAMGLICPKNKIDNITELDSWLKMTEEKLGIKRNVDLDWKWK